MSAPGPSKPNVSEELREAIAVALGGDWQGAHEVAQKYEDDVAACWLHAVVHRMEGDLGNADYWYRRSGRTRRDGLSTDAELREILSSLSRG